MNKPKLYKRPPDLVFRIQIKRAGDKPEYINTWESTLDDVLEFCKTIIESQKLSPFQEGRVTNIEVRECLGAHNGKAKSISFKGLSPNEVYQLIMKEL